MSYLLTQFFFNDDNGDKNDQRAVAAAILCTLMAVVVNFASGVDVTFHIKPILICATTCGTAIQSCHAWVRQERVLWAATVLCWEMAVMNVLYTILEGRYDCSDVDTTSNVDNNSEEDGEKDWKKELCQQIKWMELETVLSVALWFAAGYLINRIPRSGESSSTRKYTTMDGDGGMMMQLQTTFLPPPPPSSYQPQQQAL